MGNVKKEERLIATSVGWRKVLGQKIKNKYGLDLFFYRGASHLYYFVSEGKSGSKIAVFENLKDCCIEKIQEVISVDRIKLITDLAAKRSHEMCGEKPELQAARWYKSCDNERRKNK